MAEFYAVLTGDLVRSGTRDARGLAAAQRVLQEGAETVRRCAWGEQAGLVGALEIFRGDAWQLVLGGPAWALRSALCLRAALLVSGHGDTRVAIGIDRVARLERRRPSRSSGPAFERSGHALDGLPRRFRMALDAAPEYTAAAPWLDVVAHLCDAVVRRWRGRQAEVSRLAMLHPGISHEALGRLLRPAVSQQAVSKTLSGAGWPALAETLARLETGERPV